MFQSRPNSLDPPLATALPGAAPSSTAPAAQPAPPSQDLAARGLNLFCTVFNLACTVFHTLNRHLDLTHFNHTAKTLKLLVDCVVAMAAIRLTLLRAPQRVTPRELARLARAAGILTRLTGRAFDFTPWAALSEEQLDRLSPRLPRCRPAPNPPSPEDPPSPETAAALFPDLSSCRAVRALGLLAHPGAALANLCQHLIRLAPLDFPLAAVAAASGAQGLSVSSISAHASSVPPSPEPAAALAATPAANPAAPHARAPQVPISSSAPAAQAPGPAPRAPRVVVPDPRFDRFFLQKFFPSHVARQSARPARRHPPP